MLTAFTKGLLLITVSEIGDKTFFIALILAMRHSRRLVFIGATAALATMTVISVLLGKAVSFLPKDYIHFAEIALFLGFGGKLLYEASLMPSKLESLQAEEALSTVEEAELNTSKNNTKIAIILEAFILTFLAEWGDRTQLATIALAAANNALGVTMGAIMGHSISAAIAVLGGRLIAGRISEKLITAMGGCLFLIFGLIAIWEGS